MLFLFSWSGAHRDLHSFPTRRSSDLVAGRAEHRAGPGEIGRQRVGLGASTSLRVIGRIPVAVGLDRGAGQPERSEEHTSELQSLAYLVCRLLLEKKKDETQRVPELVT